MVQLTNTRRSDGAPDPDGSLKEVARIIIRHYRNIYLNHPDPIAFIPLAVDTTGRLYEEFIRLLFLHAHREGSTLVNELTEESDQFRRSRGFQSPSTFPLGLPYRFLVSFVRVVPRRFWLLPSSFFLCVLTKWHMLSVYFYPFVVSITHHRFSVTPFLSLALAFFYSAGNKVLRETLTSQKNHGGDNRLCL